MRVRYKLVVIAAMLVAGWYWLFVRGTTPESPDVCWRTDAFRFVVGPNVYTIPRSANPHILSNARSYLAWIGYEPNSRERRYCQRKTDVSLRVMAFRIDMANVDGAPTSKTTEVMISHLTPGLPSHREYADIGWTDSPESLSINGDPIFVNCLHVKGADSGCRIGPIFYDDAKVFIFPNGYPISHEKLASYTKRALSLVKRMKHMTDANGR